MKFSCCISKSIKIILFPFRLNTGNCYVEMDHQNLQVRLAGLFTQSFAIFNIEGIEHIHWPWYYGLGVKLSRQRTVGVLVSFQNTVRIRFKDTVKIPIAFGINWKAKHLVLSLEDVEGFMLFLQPIIQQQ